MCSIPVKQSRKIRKPLMEKKRRDRINECLEQLKNFILDQKENLKDKKPSKLEKADILELTVKILRKLHDKVINEARRKDTSSEKLLEINGQLEYRLSGENLIQLQPSENYSDERFAAGYRACMKRVRVLLDKRYQDSMVKSSTIKSNSSINPHLSPAKETTNLIQNNDEFHRKINPYYNDETHTTNLSSRSNSPMDCDGSYACYTNPRLSFDENSMDFSHRSSPSSMVLDSPHDDQHLIVPLRTNLNTTIYQSNTSSQPYMIQDNTKHHFNENQTLQKKDMWRPW